MKLLQKSTVASEQAIQKKAQIDEGVKLATRIDALRRTLADLERQHETYILGMENELKRRTEGLIEGVKDKMRELLEIEARRIKLLEPLAEKWSEVNEKEKEVNSILAQAQENAIVIEREKEKYLILGKKMKESQARTRIRERELSRVYAQAEENLEESVKVLKDAENKVDGQLSLLRERSVKLDERERMNNFDFMANKNQKTLLDDRESELSDRERQINDKYETLLRTINRTKK